ncbi:2-deoxyglucose-6-phosphate phosphatase, putative [Entamoeba invadens IP1]|uniref:2-deoxyglucose-6-phosphate phosphatase, putative n=1 Tax=Entamoeba invadens IP1 TaxID=370355 RepID=UPI0002C3EA4E|nr:2-deoxyglucose-6-phosphate phosphatase, putative [Entamoeba invadens IP1]ELP85141.1 2-deoxyglucose-6-phosphate phosphatase, putative [Entamoeba invadens IP1]|eukprot:XP_004184487.1 2-deoxyglucose-6-phosphate phosphatase, putative [Entamoeba invadens IP1]
MLKYTCALFDLDGTLLDTEEIYAKINQEFINKYGDGKEYTWETRSKVMGVSSPKANQTIIDTHKITKTREEMVKYKKERLETLKNEVKAFPGALEILKKLKGLGMKVAIATSSQQGMVDYKMFSHQDMMKYVDILVCGDSKSVKKSKPNPDIFIHAAHLCGEYDMKKVVVFEDSVNGVLAGVATGGLTVAIPDSHVKQDPTFKKADVLLNSLTQFDVSILETPSQSCSSKI